MRTEAGDLRWGQVKLRVRYQETDQMGVVYHANYLNWFEIGRTEWIRSLGIRYHDMEQRGLLLPVIDLSTSYRQPAYYDDIVRVFTRLVKVSALRVEFEVMVCRFKEDELSYDCWVAEPEGEVLATGSTRHVWMDTDWNPVRIDRKAPELYERIGGK